MAAFLRRKPTVHAMASLVCSLSLALLCCSCAFHCSLLLRIVAASSSFCRTASFSAATMHPTAS